RVHLCAVPPFMPITPYGQAATQFRHPLHTSCWMKTVSNSVRMMAPVGQTSMQLACLQCLQTSDIISQATPLPCVATGWSVTCSTKSTWRQFWASRLPVLSKLSARKAGALPWSWFHSLHATSHALQPMQTLVSVKNPYAWPAWILGAISEPHQIGGDLRVPAVAGVKVERNRRDLIDHGHRGGIGREVDVQYVGVAGFAGLDPDVRKDGRDR